MKIALVGFTGSYNDLRWLEMAGAWVAAREVGVGWESAARGVFDLRGVNRRNFLDDVGVYDGVVLFAIYNPPAGSAEFAAAVARCQGQTALAPNHSRAAWADRLARTNAKYLFIFRRDDSIDGEWLGEVDGYDRLPEEPGVFGVSIYVRR